jgi:hypothetical protein
LAASPGGASVAVGAAEVVGTASVGTPIAASWARAPTEQAARASAQPVINRRETTRAPENSPLVLLFVTAWG